MSREDSVANLVREGAPESTAREVLALASRIRSVADVQMLLGQPDRTDIWTDELDERAKVLSEKRGLPYEKWQKCHIYYERWKPVYIMAHEFDGGVVRCSVAVCPTPAKDSLGVPHKR
jgi:hypothetical protein